MNTGAYRPRNEPEYPIVSPDGTEQMMTFANGRDIIRWNSQWHWRDANAVLAAHQRWGANEAIKGGLNRGSDLNESDRAITVAEDRRRLRGGA